MTDVAAYFALVIGLVALPSAGMLLAKVLRARSFVPVPARIVEKSVVGATTATAAGDSGGPRYELRAKYAYQFNGRDYVGDRLSLFRTTYLRGAAEKQLARLPDDVTVFVDPGDPSTSVLSRKGMALCVFLGVFGAVTVVVSLLIVLA